MRDFLFHALSSFHFGEIQIASTQAVINSTATSAAMKSSKSIGLSQEKKIACLPKAGLPASEIRRIGEDVTRTNHDGLPSPDGMQLFQRFGERSTPMGSCVARIFNHMH